MENRLDFRYDSPFVEVAARVMAAPEEEFVADDTRGSEMRRVLELQSTILLAALHPEVRRIFVIPALEKLQQITAGVVAKAAMADMLKAMQKKREEGDDDTATGN